MRADDPEEQTGPRIRAVATEDIDAVVEFSLRAWVTERDGHPVGFATVVLQGGLAG